MEFKCPKCGGKSWGTLDADNMDVVSCSSDEAGVSLSQRCFSGSRPGPMCRWRGRRSECGLAAPKPAADQFEAASLRFQLDDSRAACDEWRKAASNSEVEAASLRANEKVLNAMADGYKAEITKLKAIAVLDNGVILRYREVMETNHNTINRLLNERSALEDTIIELRNDMRRQRDAETAELDATQNEITSLRSEMGRLREIIKKNADTLEDPSAVIDAKNEAAETTARLLGNIASTGIHNGYFASPTINCVAHKIARLYKDKMELLAARRTQ